MFAARVIHLLIVVAFFGALMFSVYMMFERLVQALTI